MTRQEKNRIINLHP